MPFYQRRGQVPPKRHTQFRQPDGSLYKEELVSSLGFSGIYSLLYHKYMPTQITRVGGRKPVSVTDANIGLQPIHLKTSVAGTTGDDIIDSRVPMLFNNDCVLYISNPTARSMDYYYKNGEADEVLFVQEGSGSLYSQFGKLDFGPGDYVVIPRTVIYRLAFTDGPVRLLVIECFGPVETVKRYRNEAGQLEEHSPYCERDIRTPDELVLEDDRAQEWEIKVKKDGYLNSFFYKHSPLDVVGWDGYLFPYAFSIRDFEPITGRLHLPPPIHQTFQAPNLVICSFVPRLFDYHPLSIPAPYNHSNIDSDEVLYYVEGNFMSRKGIDVGSFTLHPGGLPHGPHPGTVEASIGAKETHELAVMVDTFKPLKVAAEALPWLDPNYAMSWNH